MRKTIIILALFNVFLIGELFAQSLTYLVRVKDKLSDKPIENASFTIKDSVVATSNYLGYAQFQGSVGDTVIIAQNDYETAFIMLPTDPKVNVDLIIDSEKLIYAGGTFSLYEYFQKAIRYPSLLLHNDIQIRINVELRVDSLGGTELIKVHNDYRGVFTKGFTKIVKKMDGTWDVSSKNKIFILPIMYIIEQLPPPAPPLTEELNAKYDMMLGEIVVTAHRL